MLNIKKLDVFPKFDSKFEKDARQRTPLGGALSVVAIIVIVFLVVSETRYFLSVVEDHSVYVDTAVGGRMNVKVNLTFHRVPCDLVTVDAVDAFGMVVKGAAETVSRTRVVADTMQPISAARPLENEEKKVTQAIDPDGAVKEGCPSCYGAERDPGDCCHTCDDVRAAYLRKRWSFNPNDISIEQCAAERVRMAALAASQEGCNIVTDLAVARVTGNLQFVPGRAYETVGRAFYNTVEGYVRLLNLSHVVHSLEFGEHFPGQANPLDGTAQIHGAPGQPGARKAVNGHFSYFVKVVPTRYETSSLSGLTTGVDSNQYSVTRHFTPSVTPDGSAPKGGEAAHVVPGVFITYDLSPIRLLVTRAHPYRSIAHFVLQLCAVCGGVLTVAGLTDAVAFHGGRRLKKMREGKQM